MITIFAVNLFVIGVAVMIHYEFLCRVTLLMPRLNIRHRFRIVLGVFVALTAQAAGVWIFAISFYLMHEAQGRGDLRYLTGLESLTGLVLITWSAFVLYLEMTPARRTASSTKQVKRLIPAVLTEVAPSTGGAGI